MLAWILKRWLVLAAAVGLLVAAYAAFGFWGVPAILRSQLTETVAESYGRELSIGDIRFNPFTLTLRVQQLSLPDADAQPLLAFENLLVNLDVASLWRRGASFREIDLDRPFARVLVRADGVLNLTDLARPAQAPEEPEAPEDAEPMRVFIDRFAVTQGRTTFEDRSRSTPFSAQLAPITFALRDFSTTGSTDNSFDFAGSSAAGERFRWAGNFDVSPLASRGRLEASALKARTVWSYLRESLPFELTTGDIDLLADYDFSTAQAPPTLVIDLQKVTLVDGGVRHSGATEDHVRLTRIEVEPSKFDLAKRSVTIGKVTVSGGSVKGWREPDGRMSFEAFAGKVDRPTDEEAAAAADRSGPPVPAPASTADSAAPGSAATAAEDPPWHIAVPDISLAGLDLQLEDRSLQPAAAFRLNPLNLQIKGYSSDTSRPLDLALDTVLNGDDPKKAGKISAKAQFTADTSALSSHVELENIDLSDLQPYIAQRTSMTLLSGSLGTSLDVTSAGEDVTIKGTTTVTRLRTVDNALREDFIRWGSLKLDGIDFDSKRKRLRIANIVADAPYARVIVAPDRTVNVSRVLSPPGTEPEPIGAESAEQSDEAKAAAKKAKAAPPKPPPAADPDALAISIGNIRVRRASANFADYWIQPNFAVSIEELNGAVTGLSSDPRTRAKVELEGKVDRYAPARIWGEINPLAASAYSDIKMSFKGIEMTTATPYSGRFAGYKIEKGKISVDLSYKVENRQLLAEHRFVIDQLQLGERVESPDAVSLPLKLAVALLKDRNGVIDVNLPVSGSLDDPKFRIGPIVWKAVLGLLTKIVTAPFALLGSLFGGGEEMNLIDFEPGDATVDAAGQEKLAALRKALAERPQLKLDVPMTYSADLDRPVLEERRLEEKLLNIKRTELASKRRKASEEEPVDATLLTDPAEHYRLLVALHRAELGKDAPLPEAALAFEQARKEAKKDEPPPADAAIAALEAALKQRAPVADTELEALGRQRAAAIQEVLLSDGSIEPTRVFVINAKPETAAEGSPPPPDAKVRMAMSLQ